MQPRVNQSGSYQDRGWYHASLVGMGLILVCSGAGYVMSQPGLAFAVVKAMAYMAGGVVVAAVVGAIWFWLLMDPGFMTWASLCCWSIAFLALAGHSCLPMQTAMKVPWLLELPSL